MYMHYELLKIVFFQLGHVLPWSSGSQRQPDQLFFHTSLEMFVSFVTVPFAINMSERTMFDRLRQWWSLNYRSQHERMFVLVVSMAYQQQWSIELQEYNHLSHEETRLYWQQGASQTCLSILLLSHFSCIEWRAIEMVAHVKLVLYPKYWRHDHTIIVQRQWPPFCHQKLSLSCKTTPTQSTKLTSWNQSCLVWLVREHKNHQIDKISLNKRSSLKPNMETIEFYLRRNEIEEHIFELIEHVSLFSLSLMCDRKKKARN